MRSCWSIKLRKQTVDILGMAPRPYQPEPDGAFPPEHFRTHPQTQRGQGDQAGISACIRLLHNKAQGKSQKIPMIPVVPPAFFA
jgi:hypothetical protein